MPQMTPARLGLGCVSIATIITGFAAGISRGIAHKNGVDFDPTFVQQAFLYGPMVAGGGLSLLSVLDYNQDPQALEEMSSNVPLQSREAAMGCYRGCGPIVAPIMGVGMVGAVTYAGYLVGKNVL